MFKKLALSAAIMIAATTGYGMAMEQPPKREENKKLTPEEEDNAHKMWLMQQHTQHRDITGQIGEKLHGLAGKKFSCPTGKELSIQNGSVETNGIYFNAFDVPFADENHTNDRLMSVYAYYGKDQKLESIGCHYSHILKSFHKSLDSSVGWDLDLNFGKSGIDPKSISIHPKVLKNGTKEEYADHDTYMWKENIEFTINPN